jgi:hypothetical protein
MFRPCNYLFLFSPVGYGYHVTPPSVLLYNSHAPMESLMWHTFMQAGFDSYNHAVADLVGLKESTQPYLASLSWLLLEERSGTGTVAF